jgi:Ca2+-binding EF-hand superfamily protein
MPFLMKSKSILLAALVAGIFLVTSASVSAAEPVGKKAVQLQLFKDADVNHDGKVTAQEFSDFVLTLVFNTYNKDGSGKISHKEYLAAIRDKPEAKTAAAEWKVMDPTNRGYITLPDYLKDQIAVNQMRKKFRELDKTGKGYITLADLPAVNN